MIGKTISHYKILEKLGEGGMGVVYKAEDTKLQRTVALKFLPLDVAGDDELRKRFINEARTASALNHPNICTIHSVEDGEQPFIAMEFVQGRELKSTIDNRQLSIIDVLNYATQIAQGLQAAHKKGIVHRDIKPANIMVTDEGLIKVMDFGLAKMKGQPVLTKTGSTLGTIAYMSPEQARNEPVDHRSDIFSFGAVLYELCSGRQPFAGDYEAATLYSVVHEQPEALPDGVPPELQRIVFKCLEKEAGGRYQTAGNLVTDLRKLQKDVDSGSSPPATQATDSGKKSKRPVLMAVAAALLIAVASYFGYEFTKTEPVPDNSVAIMYIENQTGEATYDRLAQNLIPQVYRNLFSAHKSVTQISPALKSELEVLQNAEALDKIAIRKVLDDAGVKYRVTAGIQKSGVGLDFLLEMTKSGDNPLVWQETLIKADSLAPQIFAQSFAEWIEAGLTIDAFEDSLHAEMNFPDNVTTREVFKNWLSAKAEASRHFYQGVYLHDVKKDFSNAVPSLEKAVQVDSRCAGAWAWGTWAHGKFGRSAALKFFRQWERSGPTQGRRPEQLLFQYFQARFISRAPHLGLKYFLELMQYEAFPNYWNFDIGNQYFNVGDFENSVHYLQEFMDSGLTPRWYETYVYLQKIYNISGKWDKALHALEVGIERNPTDRRLMVSMIRQHLMLGQKEKANEWFEKYKAISKKMVAGLARGYITYGTHYALLGDYDGADENYTKALSEIDVSADQVRLIAASYVGMKKTAIAEETLLDADNRYPNDIYIFHGLSRLYRTTQEYGKAVEYGEKVTTLDPSDDLDLRLAKALFHVANGESLQAKAEWESLISEYEKLLTAPSTHPFNTYRLGAIYALQGDVQSALQMLESAFQRGHRRHLGFIFYGDHFLYGDHLDYLYDPDLENVRNDPRTKEEFAALIQRVKASYPAIGRQRSAEK